MGTVTVPFQVTGWTPDPVTEGGDGPVRIGRVTLHKSFSGPLTGTSVLAMTSVAVGEAPVGYVALELVTGTLDGRSGSFVLQHTGVVEESAAPPNGVVLPGTGTGELAGLSGTMTIEHEESGAVLVLDFELP